MKRLFATFLVLSTTTSLLCQTIPQNSLTLKQAIDVALDKNVQVRQAENNVDAAQSGVLAAYGTYFPSLTAIGGWTRQQNDNAASTRLISGVPILIPESFSVTNNFQTQFSAGYDIFDGFSREGTLKRAVAASGSTYDSYSRTKQQIVFEVQSDYLAVLRNEQLVKVSEENLKRDQRQLDRITESNKVGSLSIADVYRQQSVVAADELNLIQTQNTFDESKADLIALIGMDVSVDYTIADSSIAPDISDAELNATKDMYKNMEQLSKTAMNSRPDYQGAMESLNGAHAEETAAIARYYPTVSAFAAYALNNTLISNLSDGKGITWGLQISWKLFDNFATNQAVQSAAVDRRNAELSLLQTERNVNVDVKKALLNLESARKQYTASVKSLQSAAQDQKVAEETYNLGAGTLVDLLTANAGLVNAEASKVNATYNYITAKMNLAFAVGNTSY
ncbi:MAG TPA: TolC family protein [Bacteroidota bacterium]|nr:TolC family protein [Bacteroidota bacterium]